MQGLTPELAIVKPRVRSPNTGDPILLEDYVSMLLDGGQPFVLELTGVVGGGKTTALKHLAALTLSDRLTLDDDCTESKRSESGNQWIVRSAYRPHSKQYVALIPWNIDDVVEYMLATHPDKTADVVGQCNELGLIRFCNGCPQLCRLLLDVLARSGAPFLRIADVMRAALKTEFDSPRSYRRACEYWYALLCKNKVRRARGFKLRQLNLLRHRVAGCFLAAESMVDRIGHRRVFRRIAMSYPQTQVLDMVVDILSGEPELVGRFDDYSRSAPSPLLASVMARVQPHWIPNARQIVKLEHAVLPGVDWSQRDLSQLKATGADFSGGTFDGSKIKRAELEDANLSGASLEKTKLHDVRMSRAVCEGVSFRGSSMRRCSLDQSNLVQACLDEVSGDTVNLISANLAYCSMRHANIITGQFTGATIQDTDFTGTKFQQCRLGGLNLRSVNLSGVELFECSLHRCDMEYADLEDASFAGCSLANALLTGTCSRGGVFRNARLCGAGLAQIDWEQADLREADLRQCAFHLGSSRSGLVDSPYPSHGTRTGFYTDDYDDRTHKAPEEIRKANLCGADLRGADLRSTDFYLVDLRGAKYDLDQRKHFQRCGAILSP